MIGAPATGARPPKPVVARPRETQPIDPDAAAAAAVPVVSTDTAPPSAIPELAPPTPAPWTSAYTGDNSQDAGGDYQIEGTTFQTPASAPGIGTGDSFVAGGGSDPRTSAWLLPLIALLLGMVIGALVTYLVIPATEYVVLDAADEPAPAPTEAAAAGIVLIPVPRGKAGPIIPPGPDHQTQVDLRNALIAAKRYYLANGKYTQETEEMAKIAPEVAWEPGVTPSRVGVVAINLCGPQESSTALLLQAAGSTGKYYGILDQPSGPAAGVYYAMAAQAFQCPNAMPPAMPWQRGLIGWGIAEPTAAPTPTATYRDDRNDPVPDYQPTPRQPTPTPASTGYPTYPGASPSPLAGEST